MCGIYCSNIRTSDYKKINGYIKYRGPDHTERLDYRGYTFIHHLLHITGEKCIQPFHKNDVICLYNGQIYNYKSFGDYKSDGECLIDLYQEYGDEFVKKLDGEFAIILFDFKKGLILISSDVFKTKPIFYSIDSGRFGCATFKAPLVLTGHKQVQSLEANTTKVFNLKTLEPVKQYRVYEFSLRQHKTSFDDWVHAFKDSLKKRTANLREKLFIGLSGGYDSGAFVASC